MQLIYGFAERVVVWIGEGTSDVHGAVALVKGLAHLFDDLESMLEQAIANFTVLRQWEALNRLLERTWWKRTWTVQEFVLAPHVMFLCGRRVFSLAELRRLPTVIHRLKITQRDVAVLWKSQQIRTHDSARESKGIALRWYEY